MSVIESGSTMALKKTAGDQIGEVVKNHPDELNNLLIRVFYWLWVNFKIIVHLKNPNWDVRTAASYAVSKIASMVPDWNPEKINSEDKIETKDLQNNIGDKFKLDEFDILSVMKNGKPLLGSAGKVFRDG